jgi:hypothetical protein
LAEALELLLQNPDRSGLLLARDQVHSSPLRADSRRTVGNFDYNRQNVHHNILLRASRERPGRVPAEFATGIKPCSIDYGLADQRRAFEQ